MQRRHFKTVLTAVNLYFIVTTSTLAAENPNPAETLVGLIFWLFIIAIYFVPTIVAFRREHEYKWVILGLNIAGFTGVCWIIAAVWAGWPDNKSLIDPILGSPTAKGIRNTGDTVGEVSFGHERGYHAEQLKTPGQVPLAGLETDLKTLEHLHKLMELGVLTPEEFAQKKQLILQKRKSGTA